MRNSPCRVVTNDVGRFGNTLVEPGAVLADAAGAMTAVASPAAPATVPASSARRVVPCRGRSGS
jgi:hypothetical protein